jgi:hypothetical protein|tara:strand:+ start:232 stop:462 length:231 start_codon:yes stop_codon:yes gene_type:complete
MTIQYKTLSFNYPLKKLKIVWNFKNRFDVYTIDNIGYESYFDSITYYLKNKAIENAENIADCIAEEKIKYQWEVKY